MKPKIVWLLIAFALSAIVLVIVLSVSGVLHKKQNEDLNNVATIKALVGSLYLLPANEEPALATVMDSSKLSSSFAGKVQNGDKILFFENNNRAIVYRPSVNKIVVVEPLQIDAVDKIKNN